MNGVPTRVDAVTDVVAIAAGQRHTLALRRDGTVWAWGSNTSGQLGADTPEGSRPTPEQVPGLPDDILAIAGGGSFSLVLDADGQVWAWGSNSDGQLGVAAGGQRTTPAAIAGPSDVETIATGRSHGLATTADGTLYAWGLNASGQLATGDEDNRDSPTVAASLPDLVATVRSAGNFSVALLRTRDLLGWGQSFNGQLGNDDSGSKADTTAPVPAQITDAVDVSAGLAHTAAITADGTVFTWGLNSFGQLGNGQTGIETSSDVPVSVTLP